MTEKMTKKWKCTVCRYTYVGDTYPDKCPKCGSPSVCTSAAGKEESIWIPWEE